ncbi:hypothetical protein SLA2020_163800 [Shorea laevis]
MKQVRRWQRIMILSLLCVSVFAPMVLFPSALKMLTSAGRKEFIEDLASTKYKSDSLRLNAIEQETGKGLKEPKLVVFKERDFDSVVSHRSVENNDSEQSENTGEAVNLLERNETNHERKEDKILQITNSVQKEKSNQKAVRHNQNVQNQSQRVTDGRVKLMRDQVIRAKAYLAFTPPGSNSHFVKQLRTRIKEVERAVGEATRDSDLPRSALQKMRSMEVLLSKASHIFPDCSAMATKLRAMTNNAEEQIRAEKSQESFLLQLAGRTTPKGFHCLSMQLTSEYFSLQPEERQFPNQQKLHDPNLYHYAVFSDNVLACAVVVNSTVSFAMAPEKIVFHVVTDSVNLPAISMWFLLNPPGKATIQVKNVNNFEWLSSKYNSTMEQKAHYPRYTSLLNHLRFYMPEVFPALNKIVFLDDDVVVQKDLSKLWSLDMKGKVNGAVETCQKSEASFQPMDMLINFSDPFVAKRFDVNACTWAFGMNLFDLKEWRRQNLTSLYQKYLKLGLKRPLWKVGSLPLGWVTFYNQTVSLDKKWHALGLGYESGVRQPDIEGAAVIHYNGIMKPWLDIAVPEYKGYWSKHMKFEHPYLQQCNIHE